MTDFEFDLDGTTVSACLDELSDLVGSTQDLDERTVNARNEHLITVIKHRQPKGRPTFGEYAKPITSAHDMVDLPVPLGPMIKFKSGPGENSTSSYVKKL